jgi:hypothetical protein
MLEIIALIFLCRSNGNLAAKKGLSPTRWKVYTAAAWLVCEMLGAIIGLSMFGKTNLLGIMGIAVFCALGGYLFVRKTLENKPDAFDDDVNQIGIDDLRPPKK